MNYIKLIGLISLCVLFSNAGFAKLFSKENAVPSCKDAFSTLKIQHFNDIKRPQNFCYSFLGGNTNPNLENQCEIKVDCAVPESTAGTKWCTIDNFVFSIHSTDIYNYSYEPKKGAPEGSYSCTLCNTRDSKCYVGSTKVK